MNSAHPSETVLLEFANGRLATADRDSVKSHISSCETCAERVENLTASIAPTSQVQPPDETLPAEFGFKDRPSAEPQRPSSSFGDYELLQEIARGGMGVVFKARQISLDRTVALKMILSGHLAGDEEVQRFRSEAEAAAMLDHPAIVPIYEVGEREGQHFFSMAFVNGTNLSDRIKTGPLPHRQAAQYAKKIAEAMAYAHVEGVIHRDLKPANVLLDANDEPRITDFGLAKRVKGDSGLTATGQILGTPSYMSPEQAIGKISEVAEASDVYSLGATLYALLTGRPPFQGESHVDTILQVQQSEPVSPRLLNDRVPQDLETICLKCLQKEAPNRYGSAAELAEELDRFLGGKPILARPISSPARVWRWCKRNPAIASLATGLIATLWVVSVGATVLYLRSAREAERTRRALYSAQMRDAFDAWNDGKHTQVRDLLDRQRPQAGQRDLRGIEYRVLDQLYEDFDSARAFHFDDRVRWMTMDSQGKQLAVQQENGGLVLIDLPEGNRRQLLEPGLVTPVAVHTSGGLAFSPQGDRLFVSGRIEGQHTACAIELPTGQLSYLDSDEDWNGQSITLLPATSALAVGGTDGDPSVRIWDLTSGDFTNVTGDGHATTAITTSPANENLLALGHHSTRGVTLWDWKTGAKGATLPSRATVTTVDFSPDGRLLAHAGWRWTRIFDITKTPPDEVQVLASISAAQLRFSPSGKLIACAQVNGLVTVWDVTTGWAIHQFSHSQKATTVAFSPDERFLYSGSWDGTVRAWPLEEVPIKQVSDTFFHVMDTNRQTGQVVVTTKGSEPAIIVWNPHNEETQRIELDNDNYKTGVALAADGRNVALTTAPDQIQIWDLETREITTTMKAAAPKVRFFPEGNKLAVATGSGQLQIWDLGTSSLVSETQSEPWTQNSTLEFSHDGRLLIIGGGTSGKAGGVQIWDVSGDAPKQEAVLDHGLFIEDLSISTDDRFIAAGDINGVTIWNVETQSRERFLPCGYTGSVAYSPDQKTLLVGVSDGIQLWDPNTGDPRGALGFHQPVIGIRFLDDERLAYIERFVGAGVLYAPRLED